MSTMLSSALTTPGAPVAAAVSVERLQRRIEQLERRLHQRDTVLEITRSFASARTLEELLLRVGEQTCAALNADRATLFLVDETHDQLWSKSASELEIKEIRIPMGVGLAGHVAVTGQTLNIDDCYTDPIWSHGRGPEIERQTGYRTRTMLVMPMRSIAGSIIGVFQIINKLLPDGALPGVRATTWPTFSDEDVEFLESIAASAAVAVQNAYLVEQMKEMFGSTVQTLATTIDRRNQETAGHSHRVALSAEILARRLGLPALEIEKIRYAGLLHDVGKVGIRDEVLTKPGKLTDDEYAQIKSHALYTRQILDEVRFLAGYEDIPVIAGQHHERLDGTGYPFHEQGDELTLGGRLLAVADIYDALRQRRVYKPTMPVAQALAILHEEAAHRHVDAALVGLLEQCLDEIERVCGPLRPGWEEERATQAATAARVSTAQVAVQPAAEPVAVPQAAG